MQGIIVSTLYLLSIFVPLTFTTINYELFEFPKFILLLSGTITIVIAWLIHIYQTRDYQILRKSSSPATRYLTYAVLMVLATQALSTFFSIHPYTSFWGYYSRFHGGLLTTICYTIIYFAALKWLDTKSTQKLIKITVGTAFLISLYGVLEHYGIDKKLWVQDVQNRVFSTLGQPNWLAAYVIPCLFLTIYASQVNKNKFLTPYYYLMYGVFFATLIFTRSRSGLLGFGLSFLTYFALMARQLSVKKIKQPAIHFALLSLAIVLIYGSAFSNSLGSYISAKNTTTPTPVAQGTALETGGTESGDIRKIVWSGALELIKEHPFLGTGPETFAYTYYWTRPVSHNLTSEWDYIYNKAHNEYLSVAATTGLLGLLGYVSWHATMLYASFTTIPKSKKVIQDKDNELRYLYPVLGASVVSFTITNFFGFSVIPVYLVTLLLTVLPTTITQAPLTSTKHEMSWTFISLALITLALIYPARLFYADYLFTKGKAFADANQPSNAVPLLEKSVSYRPSLDLFHSYLGESYAAIAATTGKSSDEAIKAQTQRYTDLAAHEAETTRKLNNLHLNDFKSRAKIYLTLATLDSSFNNRAVDELVAARELAPTDPKLAYNLGLVYTRINQLDKAEKQMREAIVLRPNYAESYYALTLLYEQTKSTNRIPSLLTEAKTNLSTYSAQLKEKIDKYVPAAE